MSKLSYQLRLDGDRAGQDRLATFDRALRTAVEIVVGGELPDDAWEQDTTGVSWGGLGLRAAKRVSTAALLAGRVSSRPRVRELAEHLARAGLCTVAAVMGAYDRRTVGAAVTVVGSLPPTPGRHLLDLLADEADQCEERWAGLFDAGVPANDAPRRRGRPRRIGSGIVPLDEDEDDEHPAAVPRGRAQLQRAMLAHLDARARLELRERHAQAGNDPALRRLEDLGHPCTNHEWLWALSRHKGPALDHQDFVEALWVRLGAVGPGEPAPATSVTATS